MNTRRRESGAHDGVEMKSSSVMPPATSVVVVPSGTAPVATTVVSPGQAKCVPTQCVNAIVRPVAGRGNLMIAAAVGVHDAETAFAPLAAQAVATGVRDLPAVGRPCRRAGAVERPHRARERKTSATRGEQAESGDDSGDPMPPQAVIPDDRPRPPVLGTRPEVDAPPVAHRRHEDIEPELEVRLPADLPHAAVTRRYGSENRVFRQIARTRGVPVRAIACERKCAHTIRAVETASAEAQPRPRLRPDIRESNGG